MFFLSKYDENDIFYEDYKGTYYRSLLKLSYINNIWYFILRVSIESKLHSKETVKSLLSNQINRIYNS